MLPAGSAAVLLNTRSENDPPRRVQWPERKKLARENKVTEKLPYLDPDVGPTPKHPRWIIGGVLFLSTVVNCIDRQTLSVLARTFHTLLPDAATVCSKILVMIAAAWRARAIGKTAAVLLLARITSQLTQKPAASIVGYRQNQSVGEICGLAPLATATSGPDVSAYPRHIFG